MKIKDIKEIVLGGLKPFADEHGFKINKGRFSLISKGKEPISIIEFLYISWGFSVELTPLVEIKIQAIHDICEQNGFHLNYTAYIRLFILKEIHKHGWHTGLRNQMLIDQTDSLTITDYKEEFEYFREEHPKAKDQIVCTEHDGWIERCNDRIMELMPYALDYIEKNGTIEAIDKLYNTLPIIRYNPNCSDFVNHCMVGIISAKLAHNPQYDELKQIYYSIMEKDNILEEYKQTFLKIIDYLDSTYPCL